MIDRIRHDIQQRLEQVLSEADKLRRALAALDSRGSSTPAAKADTPAPARRRTQTSSTSRAARAAGSTGAATRTPPGATRLKVLGALSTDNPMTAGEVAKAAGLGRPTVSTTLSRLARTGEVVKAERGYRLPETNGTA